MVLQLWHVGRISHPSFQPGGALPIAPSAIRPNAKAFTANGFEEIPTPRALETSEIPGSRNMRKERGTRLPPASTVSRYMARTAI
jgi:2,4-dienoyl-CoA reductase-like NADH-dependent reductase (Old Yellow Enzyme family)